MPADEPRQLLEEIEKATTSLLFCAPEMRPTHQRRLTDAMNALAGWAEIGGKLVIHRSRDKERELVVQALEEGKPDAS